ncbi:MAG: DUF2125 domain-containing protein [Alphaproteobacteria bacterium]
MRYSHRIFVYGPVAMLALAAIGYSLYWNDSAHRLEAALDAANGREIIPGIVFAFAEKEVGGFPFRLDAVLSGVTFAHRGADGETAWRTEKLAIHELSYSGDHYLFEAAGLQSITWPEDRSQRVHYLTPGMLRASAILRSGKLARFDLDSVGVSARDARQDAAAACEFFARRLQLHLRTTENAEIQLVVKAEGFRIGNGFAPVFGPDSPLIVAEGRLSKGKTLDGLRAGSVAIAAASEAWRRGDGVLQITGLSWKWGAVTADAAGVIALDDAHRVTGSFDGYLGNAQVASAAKADAAVGPLHAAIAALAQTPPDTHGRIPLRLDIREGRVVVGGTQVGEVGPLY